MSTQPIPIQQFAQSVRAKYPGAYDSLTDTELTGKIIQKYPEYKDHIQGMAETQFEKDRPGKGITSEGVGTAIGQSLMGVAGGLMKQLDPTQPFRHPEEIPIVRAAHEAKSAFMDPDAKWWEVPTAALGSLVGVSAERQREHGRRGEGGAIMGEAAVPAAMAVGGELAAEAAPLMRTSKNAAAELMREPATARQSQLGRPGTIKPMLPSMLQKYMIPDWLIPKGEVGTPTRPGPFMEIPARMPNPKAEAAAAPTVDPLKQAISEGRASRLPTKMPKPKAELPPGKTSPFEGATSTAAKGPTEADAMFQKMFGKEYKEAGDLAQWETGSREGNTAAQTAAGWRMPQGKPNPFGKVKMVSKFEQPAEVPPVKPGPFEGMISSAKPGGEKLQLPAAKTASQSPKVQMVSKFEQPQQGKGRIVSPESKPPHVEGSYWSFGEKDLRKAVMGGDRDAAIVYKQRFGELPEGASFLTDVGSAPNRGLYSSRRK